MIRKTKCFEGCSWFKYNNLGLALGMALKIYTSVAKELTPKVRKFLGLIPTFVEIIGKNWYGVFLTPHPELSQVPALSNIIHINIKKTCSFEEKLS